MGYILYSKYMTVLHASHYSVALVLEIMVAITEEKKRFQEAFPFVQWKINRQVKLFIWVEDDARMVQTLSLFGGNDLIFIWWRLCSQERAETWRNDSLSERFNKCSWGLSITGCLLIFCLGSVTPGRLILIVPMSANSKLSNVRSRLNTSTKSSQSARCST